MKPYNIYKTFRDTNISINSKDLYTRLENKIEKNKLEQLIFRLDEMDMSKDGVVDFTAVRQDGLNHIAAMTSKCFVNYDASENAQFSKTDLIRIFRGDFSKELEVVATTLQEIEEENTKKVIEQFAKDIPADILNKLSIGEGMKVSKLESGYKTEQDNTTIYYDENGDFLKSEIRYPNGLKETVNAKDEVTVELGKTEGKYFPVVPMLKNVSVNKGLPNQTDFEILYNDDGEAIDIKLNSDTLIKLDENNKNLLLDMINNGKEFGFNYNIQVDGYSIIVSELENQ